MLSTLEFALKYASLGWHILPILPGQKTPASKHGVLDATTDPEQIKKWFSENSSWNLAVACGPESKIFVIDIDVSDKANGWESLKEFPPLPDTIRQDTPSGGAHFFYHADDPPANRIGFRPGIDIRSIKTYVLLPPSIHPNGKQYSWTPGCAPWEIKPAEFPDFMRPTKTAPWAAQSPQSPGASEPGAWPHQEPAGGDVLKRASLYLAEVKPAVQGQDGHGSLLWAAQCMVGGFGLSDSQALDLLESEYNPRCVPPWDLSDKAEAKEFARKVSEARKEPLRGKLPLWLLRDPAYAPVNLSEATKSIDIDRLITEAHPETEIIQTPPPPAELQFLTAPTGLLGDICSWINSTAIKEQPFLALACTLAFLGTLFGRKIKDTYGSRTNLYCMGVVNSSAGKDIAPHQIRRLLEVAGGSYLLAGDDIASDSGIEGRMSREPATLFLLDEIGHLLSHIKSGASKHHARVVPILMRLYSSARSIYKGREYADAEQQRIITQPCCCIYGTSDLTRFVGGITPEELQDGWLSRCLVFHTDIDPLKSRGRFEAPIPKHIVEQVHLWLTREIKPQKDENNTIPFTTLYGEKQPPLQIIVPTKPEAEQLFILFDELARKQGKKYPGIACLWAKAEENARRVALIVAASEQFDSPIITLQNADYATRLIRYLLFDFSKTFVPEIVSGIIDSQKRKLLAIIKQYGINGCKQRDLTRASQWLNGDQRKKLLDDLEEAGEIFHRRKAGQKAIYFWTAKDRKTYEKKGEK